MRWVVTNQQEACNQLEAQSSHEQASAEDKKVEELISKVGR